MSVLINMEMPTSCADCPLGDSLHCQVLPSVPALWAEYTNAIREKRLHSDCPLVSVPPHGRLIDADDVNNHILGYVDLRECPTIIPAEEEPAKDINVTSKPYDLLYEEVGLGIR